MFDSRIFVWCFSCRLILHDFLKLLLCVLLLNVISYIHTLLWTTFSIHFFPGVCNRILSVQMKTRMTYFQLAKQLTMSLKHIIYLTKINSHIEHILFCVVCKWHQMDHDNDQVLLKIDRSCSKYFSILTVIQVLLLHSSRNLVNFIQEEHIWMKSSQTCFFMSSFYYLVNMQK